ncbi:PepSY domain-containing protein [Clostridium rectalis]|uniref:PepSY domain-containing protein n=1 Tax=Clostridium rectalis TaxID=2040295 RepID=UPI000F630DDA
MKMNKILTIFLSTILTMLPASTVYGEGSVEEKNKKQFKIITIFWEKSKHNNNKATTNIALKKFNSFEEINEFFIENISKFGLKKGSLKSTKTLKDEKDRTFYHTIYQIDNIPVYYGRIVFTTEKDCTMSSISGRVDTSFENGNWGDKIKVSKNIVIKKAKDCVEYENIYKSKADLFLYNFQGNPYVVYLVDLITNTGEWNVFVNAENGSIINKFNNTPTITKINKES